MKAVLLKENVLQAVLIAERIAGKKESLPILSCVLFSIEKDVSVRATNLEAGVDVRVVGESLEKGIIAVPASVLSQTLRSIGGEKITFSKEGNNLILESRGTKTLIKSVPHDEFPQLPDTSGREGTHIQKEKLVQGLQAVSYAASPSMIRPELGSVYMRINNGQVLCVATDSFRLAEKTIRGEDKGGEVEVLIPLKHVMEIIHILEHVNVDDVRIVVDETQLTIVMSGTRYVSRIIEGTFPNYTEIIPKKFTTEATVLKSDFSDILKKARVFSGAEQYVGLHVYPKKKLFTATAQSSDVGEMSDSIDAALSGDDMDINFHIGYLSDCLSSIASDSLTLQFSGVGKPLVIKGVSDPTFTYLVMPLNR